MADYNTKRNTGVKFARRLAKFVMDAELPERVCFMNEKCNLVEQTMQYEWRPILCKFCQKHGHGKAVGKKALIKTNDEVIETERGQGSANPAGKNTPEPRQKGITGAIENISLSFMGVAKSVLNERPGKGHEANGAKKNQDGWVITKKATRAKHVGETSHKVNNGFQVLNKDKFNVMKPRRSPSRDGGTTVHSPNG
ncbi:hypothetical protein FXO38_32262 [Capsicum annuum]|nr:hypothetical protein FXO38_32262 [Capsicum annuum]KAF3622907.1 hypothetical protein FXO37_32136 [Capsicum annuum]